jgi:hypothetical protein
MVIYKHWWLNINFVKTFNVCNLWLPHWLSLGDQGLRIVYILVVDDVHCWIRLCIFIVGGLAILLLKFRYILVELIK